MDDKGKIHLKILLLEADYFQKWEIEALAFFSDNLFEYLVETHSSYQNITAQEYIQNLLQLEEENFYQSDYMSEGCAQLLSHFDCPFSLNPKDQNEMRALNRNQLINCMKFCSQVYDHECSDVALGHSSDYNQLRQKYQIS